MVTNKTILAPLASSPVISIIIAINSDGTEDQQNNVTNSLVIVNVNDNNFIENFEQDSVNFQLYHYIFPPLQRRNMGRYIVYSGTYVYLQYSSCTHAYLLYII